MSDEEALYNEFYLRFYESARFLYSVLTLKYEIVLLDPQIKQKLADNILELFQQIDPAFVDDIKQSHKKLEEMIENDLKLRKL